MKNFFFILLAAVVFFCIQGMEEHEMALAKCGPSNNKVYTEIEGYTYYIPEENNFQRALNGWQIMFWRMCQTNDCRITQTQMKNCWMRLGALWKAKSINVFFLESSPWTTQYLITSPVQGGNILFYVPFFSQIGPMGHTTQQRQEKILQGVNQLYPEAKKAYMCLNSDFIVPIPSGGYVNMPDLGWQAGQTSPIELDPIFAQNWKHSMTWHKDIEAKPMEEKTIPTLVPAKPTQSTNSWCVIN